MPRGRIALIASLVLNIFLIGAIVGGVWRWTHPRVGRFHWRQASYALPHGDAEALRQQMRATVQASRPLVREGRDARAEAARLFVQPVFDSAGVAAQLDRARAADVALRTRLEARIVTYAATLPQDERRTLAEALRRGPLRQPRKRAD